MEATGSSTTCTRAQAVRGMFVLVPLVAFASAAAAASDDDVGRTAGNNDELQSRFSEASPPSSLVSPSQPSAGNAGALPSSFELAAGSASAPVGGPVDYNAILARASKKAIGGGKSGALAGASQVLLLMWLRTVMNYQYRFGTSTTEAFDSLWAEGGWARLYRGLPFAMVQGPLSRFGDTAANIGVLALLEASPSTALLPVPLKTAVASATAGAWRIVITPIDTMKTTLQVGGEAAVRTPAARPVMERSCNGHRWAASRPCPSCSPASSSSSSL